MISSSNIFPFKKVDQNIKDFDLIFNKLNMIVEKAKCLNLDNPYIASIKSLQIIFEINSKNSIKTYQYKDHSYYERIVEELKESVQQYEKEKKALPQKKRS